MTGIDLTRFTISFSQGNSHIVGIFKPLSAYMRKRTWRPKV